MAVWLFLEGNSEPMRGRSDANGNLIDAEAGQLGNGEGIDYERAIDLSKVREVKIRSGWNGFLDVKHYGEIKIEEKE